MRSCFARRIRDRYSLLYLEIEFQKGASIKSDVNLMLKQLAVINLSQDIQSLSNFKRNTPEMIEQMKTTGNPLVLTVNGKAEIIVQDAAAYQKLIDKIEHLEALIKKQNKSHQDLELLDLYGAAADIEFVLDDYGISNELDNDLNGVFNE